MRYTLCELGEILGKGIHGQDTVIKEVVTDSRKIFQSEHSLFVALEGDRFNGHDYIPEAYEKGVRSFIISQPVVMKEDASFIQVENSLVAIQTLAKAHRSSFSNPVIAITGSRGKTSLKEKLASLLGHNQFLHRSPRSYNSQVGVPLSILGIEDEHELSILEAGISKPGEMEKLARMIKPDMGVFTGLREDHQENFQSLSEKLEEKLKLFKGCHQLIYGGEESWVLNRIKEFCSAEGISALSWGYDKTEDIHVLAISNIGPSREIEYCAGGKLLKLKVDLKAGEHVENTLHCMTTMYALGMSPNEIAIAFHKEGHSDSTPLASKSRSGHLLISHTGLIDAAHLQLDVEQLISKGLSERKTVVLIETQSSLANPYRIEGLANSLSSICQDMSVQCIGTGMEALTKRLSSIRFFKDAESFKKTFNEEPIKGDVLLYGTWSPEYILVQSLLEAQGHHTELIIDMEAVIHNLNHYRALIGPDVKIMAMVKASAYGTGDTELAKLLEFHRVDYLAVAYPDEGHILRRQGLECPIMVMNSSIEEVQSMADARLEPVIYSLQLLQQVCSLSSVSRLKIHLEFDSGMHRLGLESSELSAALNLIDEHGGIEVLSVFSHLLASDDSSQDKWTQSQLRTFRGIRKGIEQDGRFHPFYHVLNSSGITRFPDARMDMVRLGIGLYGHSGDEETMVNLKPILKWNSSIRQIRNVKQGETVGYGGQLVLDADKQIGILPIGYADGIHRSLGNGIGRVFINGRACPFVGNICMDMCMVDLRSMNVPVGAVAEIVGPHQSIEDLARDLGTIPYEILTSIPSRVKRSYVNG